jgi:transcriptional regulator with XRE-family HTH domain
MAFAVMTPPQLGEVLRGLRKSRGLTQAGVAGASGLRQKTVSLLETAPQRCSVDSLMRYLAAVRAGLSLDLRAEQARAPAADEW